MRKIIFYPLMLVIALSYTSCKEKEKNVDEKPTKEYHISQENTVVNWTAYKTTDKVPVNGTFKSIEFDNKTKGKTVAEALNGLTFSIPVSSLFTKDTLRDGKLKKVFFGNLSNTDKILGKITMDKDLNGSVRLIMNGVSHDLPLQSKNDNGTITIESVLNLDNWKAQKALELLNLACKELHTGADGVTKTWNEVAIKVVTTLNKI